MVNYEVTTADLVKDYTSYQLRKSGYDSGNDWCVMEAHSSIHRALHEIGDKFESAFYATFADMTQQINIHGNDLQDILYSIYDQTVERGEGLAWGRIVGIFVFSAKLSVVAQTASRTDVVSNLIQWTTEYLEQQRIVDWISKNGGWTGFLQFYRSPNSNATIDGIHLTWNKAYDIGLNMLNGAATMFNTIMG